MHFLLPAHTQISLQMAKFYVPHALLLHIEIQIHKILIHVWQTTK